MKKGFFLTLIVFIVQMLFLSKAFSSELKLVSFSQRGEMSELEFTFDANNVQANKFQIKDDKQIIVDLTDTTAAEKVLSAFDTSEFSGAVIFVKAYKKPKSENDLRIAIQLRDNVRSVLVRKPNKILLQIENRYGVFSEKKADDGLSYKEKIADAQSDMVRINIPKSDALEDILENITMSGKKKYVGKKITVNLKNIKPEEILKMIAETSGFNIIATKEVKDLEAISLNLVDIPWDQALDTVLDINKLVAKKNGVILIVSTLEAATKEREAEKKAKETVKDQEPILTKVFPISFANIDELKGILSEYSSDKRGKIGKDTRTNSLIVKDTSEVIERMKKIVELLDAQTPQVLIESKIVEVSESYSKEIGLNNGIVFGYDPFSATQLANANAGTFSFATAPDSARSVFGVNITRFNKLINLDLQLKLMESESKGKVISSPKVITKNNVSANISQNEATYYFDTSTSVAAGVSTTTSSWKPQNSALDLTVTPQVTNEGSISMDVSVEKGSLSIGSQPGAPSDEVKRKIKTQVLVDSGATVVIGGIYTYSHQENHSGIPFLKDIPLLGWLFRSKYNPTTIKKELIIFLTPRIINQEEAGLVDKG